MMKTRYICLLICLFICSSCATNQYYWGSYEKTLYKHYKNPGDLENLAQKLFDIIEKGEFEDRVPPGIYAEYGYVLMAQGEINESIKYFKLEKENWPESTLLMDTMINNTKLVNNNKKNVNNKIASGETNK